VVWIIEIEEECVVEVVCRAVSVTETPIDKRARGAISRLSEGQSSNSDYDQYVCTVSGKEFIQDS
jgi:hypothetical protein